VGEGGLGVGWVGGRGGGVGGEEEHCLIIIITRVSSEFIVHEATSLPRGRLGHHQTNPAIQDLWSLGQLRPQTQRAKEA